MASTLNSVISPPETQTAPPTSHAPISPPPRALRLKTQCSVCSGVLYQPSKAEFPVCVRADCGEVARQKTRIPVLHFERYFAQRVKDIRKSVQYEKALIAAEQAQIEQEKAENRAFWASKLSELELSPPEDYPLTPIPSCRRKLTNLPEKRRRLFRDYLNRVLAEAAAETNRKILPPSDLASPPPVKSSVLPLIAQACTICAGGCCTSGSNHAYLDKETFRKLMTGGPNGLVLRPLQIMEYYLSHLGAKTYRDSCIYHSATGCNLPIWLRSATCLNYYCSGLKGLISAFEADRTPTGAFLLIRRKERWESSTADNNQIEQGVIAFTDRSPSRRVEVNAK